MQFLCKTLTLLQSQGLTAKQADMLDIAMLQDLIILV